jgi:EAL domain-containing protein (putative c-di-GMP-specific phosphodiesterase class I)
MVQRLGCDHAQGFLFSQPLPPADFEQLIASWNPHAAPAFAA